ncbi:hypothetical protein [Acidovorax sp. Leaf160]|nr:hypothetical protein [Acidovorax sp. Leaf160]
MTTTHQSTLVPHAAPPGAAPAGHGACPGLTARAALTSPRRVRQEG